MPPVLSCRFGRALLVLVGCFLGHSLLAADKPIRLRNPISVETAEAARRAVVPETGLFVIQFRGALQPEWRVQLAARGVTLLRYVPEDAFVARFNGVVPAVVRGFEFVQFVGRFGAHYKLDSRLRETPPAPDQTLAIAAVLAPGISEADAAAARSSFSGSPAETPLREGRILRGRISSSQLQTFAELGTVLWIEPAPRMQLFDEVSSRIVAGDGTGNQTRMQELGFDGSGVTVSVADSGLDSGDTNFMHPDIAGRVRALFHYGAPGQLADAADEHSHGTHCAGIIAGNGATGETDEFGFLYGLGVAPGASLIGQRLFDAAGNYAPPPSFETVTRDAKRAGADIGSNSWGEDTHGVYDISAMEFDALVRDADVLSFGDQQYILEFSAGNAGPGYQTIGSPAVAKNVIATGASQNDRFNLPIEEFAIYADGRDAMADFSSRGPCADGRIKPDLVAPGSWIASLRSIFANDGFAWWPISDRYLYQGGTSQAGPQVSGAAAVFVQYWRETRGGVTPSPALVKAALINSAVDMDDGFTTDFVPNQDEGWGRVNLAGLIGSPRDYDFVDQSTPLVDGAVFERRVLVGSPGEPLRVTMVYTDVPGLPAAAVALVNDLDLEVVAPTGEVFRGNQFSNGESLPGAPLADTINNVEAVHLNAPVAGEYLVRIRATRIVEDARRDTPAVDQDFALVISGGFAPAGTGIVTFDRKEYRAPDRVRLTLVDSDLAGQPSAVIQVRSAVDPGASVTLHASGAHGVFTGEVATVTGPSGPGQLRVGHDSVIEAVHADGAPATVRVFTARADLVAPGILDVRSGEIFGQVQVTWSTDEAASGEIYYGQGVPSFALTNRVPEFEQEFALPNLGAGEVAQFFVVAQDVAGNRTTNNNGGAFFAVTNSQALAVLLVDSYTDYGGIIAAPPLSGYTDALEQVGWDYDVFDARAGAQPSLEQLQSYSAVIWRMDELIAPDPVLVQRIAAYVTNGGSLLISSMEGVTRLLEGGATDFVRNVLQVQSHTEDVPVAEVIGFGGDPVGAGIDVVLDYAPYAELLALLAFGGVTDPSDWVQPTTNGTPVLLAEGQVVGVRSPRPGADVAGRVIYLSFPLDAVPLGFEAGNNRAGLLRNALTFLAPPANTSLVSLDSDVYSLPGRAIVEVEDADLRGLGSIQVTVSSSGQAGGMTVVLAETVRAGVFRGHLFFAETNLGAPGVYQVSATETVRVAYFDASSNDTNVAIANFDTNAPAIANVFIEPGYLEAIVFWDTSKPADSLVQYGERPDEFPVNFTEFDSLLVTSHELFLSGLKPNTTYYVRVTSRDRAGNAATDDNNGMLYSFTTLEPRMPPWSDTVETNSTDWSVITADESASGWTRGEPGGGESAHSGTHAWGSNLEGGVVSDFESYLVSPGILLTGGNRATLRFWQNYDISAQGEFDLQLAAVQIITNVSTAPVLLHQLTDEFSDGWEEVEIDLTPYLGQVVYIVWYHFLFSIDSFPRMGWLVDDVSIELSTVVPGTVQITNNLWQAVFALSGPSGGTGSGRWTAITNAAPGQYRIEFGDVPYFTTPAPQTNTLTAGGSITFHGQYTFTDSNSNAIPDDYESAVFGKVDPHRRGTGDTDGDGLSDFGEFVAGTDPDVRAEPLRVRADHSGNGTIWIRWDSRPGRAYRVHGSSDLRTWSAMTSWINAIAAETSHAIDPVGNGDVRFMRIEENVGSQGLAPSFKVLSTSLPGQQLRLDWPSAPGHGYRVWQSEDLEEWHPVGDWIRAAGFQSGRSMTVSNTAAKYFRVEAAP